MGQFTYPASALSTMIINAGGSINGNTNSSVTITPDKNEVTGSAESKVGCSYQQYKIYFAAQFDRSFSSYGTWNGDIVMDGSTYSSGGETGAFIVFNASANNVIRVQVGISFVSIANARLNLAAENANFNINAVAKEGDAAWNKRLQSIQVHGETPDKVITFYTALYHVFFHPNIFNDVNGEYLGFDGEVHKVLNGHAHYENIPGWDQYRTMIVLLSILAPSVASDVAQSLVDDAQQGDGHIPRWAQANTDSHGMSGDGGSIMIAQAYAYGARNFDKSGALNAMVNGQPNIREGFEDYLKIGYVPIDSGFPGASITLEYSSADFAIAQFALALGDTEDHFIFLQRSDNWQNLFNTTSGYIQPRNKNGSWTHNFNPANQEGFEEGDSAQYSWMVPHNLRGLFDQMGGNSAVVNRLDTFLALLNDGTYSSFAYMGNQPSVKVQWEYYFAQAPSRTQEVVRRIQTQLFKNTPEGLPGNDDAGSMSSWYIFSTIGIYPVIPGIGGFVIGSPLFDSVTLNLAGGHQIQINTLQINTTEAFDVNPYVQSQPTIQSPPYIQSLKINDKNTTSLWIPWSIIQKGATLDFTLGSSPSKWGINPEDAPPSYSPIP
jgi:predicted alpha-1,2-mannosidase